MAERQESLSGWVTVDQAARIKGVTKKAVYGRIRAGKLAAGKLGSIVVIRRAALDEWEISKNIQEGQQRRWNKTVD
jgi:excisionase family DNA binding protein